MQMSQPILPLAGVKVVEFAQNLAGPYAAEILATLGADVLKIERPDGGDDARGWGPPFLRGSAATFHAVNHNKRSITLDLKDPESIDWLKNYLLSADVLVQNLRPGVLDGMGLDSETLLKANPRLVYCSLWAFGRTGPMQQRPGYEPMVQAFSGMFKINGTEDGPPTRIGMPALDLGSGLWTALGCIAALYRRHSTGLGGVVDTSLFETALAWQSVYLAGYSLTGKQPERHRSGSSKLVVFQSFDTSDGEVIVAAANDRLFAKLVTAAGRADWAKDPRFASNALRVEQRKLIIPTLAAIFLTASTEQWIERLEAAGVPCAPINDMHTVSEHPQTKALGMYESAGEDYMRLVGLPVSFDGKRPTINSPAPLLGEHNEELGLPPLKS